MLSFGVFPSPCIYVLIVKKLAIPSKSPIFYYIFPNKKVPDKKRITSKKPDTNRSETEKKPDPAICVFQNFRVFFVFCPYLKKKIKTDCVLKNGKKNGKLPEKCRKKIGKNGEKNGVK